MPCSLELENHYRAQGLRFIAGVDEAGRGPLAGPVRAAAVILPDEFTHAVLNDSKQLSPQQRESIYEELRDDGRILIGSAEATVEEIDRLNILRATHLAMERAVRSLSQVPDLVLIDGKPVPRFPFTSHAVVKGDTLSLSIAAASVIAKVERDRLMGEYAARWPNYGFEQHKGYGTKQHLDAIARHGPCAIHRKSFAPIAQREFDFG